MTNNIRAAIERQLITSEYLSDRSERDKKWDSKRSLTQEMESHYWNNPLYRRLAKRMHSCADILDFVETKPNDNGEIKLKLASAWFCKVRHCPVCQWRRSMRNIARFFKKLPDLREAFPKHRWIFLTLTVRNPPMEELRSTIQQMNRAWQRLIQRKNWPAVGWIRTVEVTKGNDGNPHPHFHCLLMVRPSYFSSQGYVTHAEWVRRWQDAARLDYTPVVHVQTVRPKVDGQTLQAAVLETLKYGTKPEDAINDADFLYGITQQLHKLHFIASGGALAGILKEEMTDQEMIGEENSGEEATQNHLIFSWRRQERRYRRSDGAVSVPLHRDQA